LTPNQHFTLQNDHPHFYNFWTWISHRYAARKYNRYSLQVFGTIEESIQRGDLQACEDLIQSIDFREFRISETALIFYTARLFADTNSFNNLPTYEQEQRAQVLF
jgi:hypothetical protein